MRLGWMALLMTVVTVCLATLSVLCLSTARVDLIRARRQAAQADDVYALERAGQDWLAALDGALAGARDAASLDGALPPGTVREGARVSTVQTQGSRTLSIAVELGRNGGFRVVEWRQSAAPPDEAEPPMLFGVPAGE